MKKRFIGILGVIMLVLTFLMTGCDVEATDEQKTRAVAEVLKTNQATPTDIDYSLERYNLIRRAYWVNGQREKRMQLFVLFRSHLDISYYLRNLAQLSEDSA